MGLIQLSIAAIFVSAAISAVMAGAWYVQQKTANSGWVDVSWSLGVGTVAFVAAAWPVGPDWPHWRQVLVAVLVASWCLRLGSHIVRRTRAATDDPRYRNMIVQWGHNAPRRMFWFLQSQAAVGVILALSITVAAHNSNPRLRIQDVIGLAILMAAIIGEAASDRQLQTFKDDPANRNAVCDVGFWRLSRHPNYFFEWLFWLSYPMIAIDFSGHNSLGWLSLAAPACMYWVLVYVSGIPPLEDHMLRSRGDAFRAYQKRTRPFFPFPL